MRYKAKYKDLQILKHSLQHYIKRTDATDKELEEEKRLLDRLTSHINELKELYQIK